MRSGCATTGLIIPWTVMTGSNTPPVFTSPAPRSSWIARRCSICCGTPLTPCRKSRAAGWTLIWSSARPTARSPARRAWTSALSAALWKAALRTWKNIWEKISDLLSPFRPFFWRYMRGGFLPLRKEDAGANSHSAGPDQCPALRAAAPLCGGAPPPRMLSYDGARKWARRSPISLWKRGTLYELRSRIGGPALSAVERGGLPGLCDLRDGTVRFQARRHSASDDGAPRDFRLYHTGGGPRLLWAEPLLTSGQSVQRPYRQAASALCGCWPFPLSILFSEGGILCRHRSNTKASSKLPFLVIGRSPSRMLPPFTRRRSGTNVTVRSSGGCLMCL